MRCGAGDWTRMGCVCVERSSLETGVGRLKEEGGEECGPEVGCVRSGSA